MIDTMMRQSVRERAGDRCEYCRLPQSGHFIPFELDHVVSRQHGGGDEAGNLAMACLRCNRQKGPNVASIDEEGRAVLLFNPRQQRWSEHFLYDQASASIVGLTPEGRATVRLLSMNDEDYLLLRQSLSEEGVGFP